MKETMYFTNGAFPEAKPEQMGVSSRDIAAYIDALREIDYDLHSLQIVRHGKRVFAAATAPYTLQDPHRLLSAAKGIIAAAVLFAIDEGKLHLDDKVVNYFQDMMPEHPSENLLSMTLYDLLTMQTGQDTDDAFMHFLTHPDEDLCRAFFQTPVTGKPGTHFFYNNSVPHLLFFLVERATGCRFEDYLNEKLCEPLGVRVTAQYNSEGIYDPVTTVVTPEDFMKIAIWFLQEGAWEGKQLIDPALIRMALAQQVCTGNEDVNARGYCMQMSKNCFGGARMEGGGVQVALMMPEFDTVFVYTSSETRGRESMLLAYDKVISRMKGKSMAADPEGEELLRKAAATMTRAPRAQADVPGSDRWEGTYHFQANDRGLEQLSFHREGDRYALQVNDALVHIGLNEKWEPSEKHVFVRPDVSIQNRIYGSDPEHCLFSGGWKDDHTFVFVLKSLASMGEFRFYLAFDQQQVTVHIPRRVSVGPQDDNNCDLLSAQR